MKRFYWTCIQPTKDVRVYYFRPAPNVKDEYTIGESEHGIFVGSHTELAFGLKSKIDSILAQKPFEQRSLMQETTWLKYGLRFCPVQTFSETKVGYVQFEGKVYPGFTTKHNLFPTFNKYSIVKYAGYAIIASSFFFVRGTNSSSRLYSILYTFWARFSSKITLKPTKEKWDGLKRDIR